MTLGGGEVVGEQLERDAVRERREQFVARIHDREDVVGRGGSRSIGRADGDGRRAGLACGAELLDGAVVRGAGWGDDDRQRPGAGAEELLVRPLLELVPAARAMPSSTGSIASR